MSKHDPNLSADLKTMANPPRPICCVIVGGRFDCRMFFVPRLNGSVIVIKGTLTPVRRPLEVIYEEQLHEPDASQNEVKYELLDFDRYALVAEFRPAKKSRLDAA